MIGMGLGCLVYTPCVQQQPAMLCARDNGCTYTSLKEAQWLSLGHKILAKIHVVVAARNELHPEDLPPLRMTCWTIGTTHSSCIQVIANDTKSAISLIELNVWRSA